ncbi:MAG: DmsE family decaheme c-type cytochrome [Gammaproteobacteria bacterium]|nr:DmsE family decaheme c-type cytochrome [Gammaproteobacteria bacterium]
MRSERPGQVRATTDDTTRKIRYQLVIAALSALFMLPAGTVLAEDEDEPVIQRVHEVPFDIPYTEEGADECLRCHDETSEFPVMDIFRTPHATLTDPDTPFAQQQCESCHGPGSEHAGRVRRNELRPPILGFEEHSSGNPEQRNAVCLDCHDTHTFSAWESSAHNMEEMACTSCHSIHVKEDPVSSASTQPEVCFTCHTEQRADAMKFSRHPLGTAAMACSDCHTPHESMNDASITHFTTTELCYTCHAEKRGPFLWEHPPATEDCSYCHEPHGSGNPALLTRRPPLLCQSCHARSDHPSLALTGDSLAADRAEIFMLGGSCTNCHSQVHGSNHPSGSGLNR